MRRRGWILLLMAAAGGVLWPPLPAAAQWNQPADLRVLDASGPSAGRYPFGTALRRSDRISLQSGDRLVILGDGGTRVLRGPGEFRLNERRLAEPQRRADVRITAPAARADMNLPNIWVLSRGGLHIDDIDGRPVRFCTYRPAQIVVGDWHASPVEIEAPGRHSWRAELTDGFSIWNRDIAREPNEYVYNSSGPDETHNSLTIVPLPARPETPQATIEALARAGCEGQAYQLAGWLADDQAEPPVANGVSSWFEVQNLESLLQDPLIFIHLLKCFPDRPSCRELERLIQLMRRG